LDAPAVALLWQGFVAASLDITLTLAARSALGLAVWAVYIADRLLDTRRLQFPPAARHRFHQQHRTLMASLCALAVVGAAILAVLQIRPRLLRAGALTAAAVLVYFVSVHWPARRAALSKEIVVALLFACGTILAPWARSDDKLPLLIAGLALFFVCLANTVAIEAFERRRLRDARSELPHPATVAIARHYVLFCSLTIAICGMAALLFLRHVVPPILIAAAIAIAALLILVVRQHRFSPDAFRVLADIALLSPIPVWFLSRVWTSIS
jgi:hypothetical protein